MSRLIIEGRAGPSGVCLPSGVCVDKQPREASRRISSCIDGGKPISVCVLSAAVVDDAKSASAGGSTGLVIDDRRPRSVWLIIEVCV